MKGTFWRFKNYFEMSVKLFNMNIKKYNIMFSKRYLSYFI